MVNLSHTAVSQIRGLSYDLGTCRSEPELESAVLDWLLIHLHAESSSLTKLRSQGSIGMLHAPADLDAAEVEANVEYHFSSQRLSDHPLVEHYFYQMRSETPLRISDKLSDRQLRSTRVFNEVLQPSGVAYQLAVLNQPLRVGRDNSGYTVNRQLSDFTDDELALATGLQPVLYALHRMIGHSNVTVNPRAAERVRLTAAEADILSLVAAGLTAIAIGHVRRTSPRTVRKHLESIYTKLGYHDRLQAVTYARSIGVLPPTGEGKGAARSGLRSTAAVERSADQAIESSPAAPRPRRGADRSRRGAPGLDVQCPANGLADAG